MLFLVLLFLLKTKFEPTNWFKETYKNNSENGLTYGNLTIEDLVNRDTDGDGVFDWEESLRGLDSTKKETTPGTPDSLAIERAGDGNSAKITTGENQVTEKLTETEKFARELFATVSATSQNGVLDQDTIEQLSLSLAERIQNTPQRKIFTVFDIKIINDDTVQSFRTYNNALINIYKKNPAPNYTILDVLEKFMVDENSVDTSALQKLDPIIEQTNKIISALAKTNVPQSISTLHLNVINSMERLNENLSDIKLYDSDSIIALGGISKYQENSTQLESDLNSLANAINQKLTI